MKIASEHFPIDEAPMFTGLVETTGEIVARHAQPPGCRLIVQSSRVAGQVKIGDSVAVSGCCLTVVETDGREMHFEAGEETLRRTILGQLTSGSPVNLERSLQLGDSLGGHLVTGHIDGVGRLLRREDEGEWSKFWFDAPLPLMRQMASKGSIAVSGVSLTLVDVSRDEWSVALIPHTLQVTTLGQLQVGDRVNLETDILAKYVERQLTWQTEESAGAPRH
jgi:riboflavin synthase